MWLRILRSSFYHQRRSFALIFISTVMGASIVASLSAVALQVSGKVARELRKYGANILIESQSRSGYLREDDLPRIKTIFWRHNIVGFVPYLYGVVNLQSPVNTPTLPPHPTPLPQRERVVILSPPQGGGDKGEGAVRNEKRKAVLVGTWFKRRLDLTEEERPFEAGLRTTAPWWQVRGRWAGDGTSKTAMVGSSLARQLDLNLGDSIQVGSGVRQARLKVIGLVKTGSFEEEQIFVSLSVAQQLLDLPGRVSKVLVSAVTVPLDDFGRRNPKTMSRREFEKWYCTAYVTSVAHQLAEVFKGGRARPVWQIAEAEGKTLNKFKLYIVLLVALALIAGALAVTTTMMVNILRRREEIGLMKALGADSFQISLLFLAEATALGIGGGLVGYFLGLFLARYIGIVIFGTAFEVKLILLPMALLSSLSVTLLGSLLPLKKALEVEAGLILRG